MTNKIMSLHTDVDECSDGSHQCSQNCHNSIGSYICTCTGNFIINGPNCIGRFNLHYSGDINNYSIKLAV